MILRPWLLIFVGEILCLAAGQTVYQRRRCVFQAKPQNLQFMKAGRVNGSVQLCERTHCCVGYFLIVDGRPKVDVLACNVAEKSCSDTTCRAQMRFNNTIMKCVCSTDLCNSNITWQPKMEQPQLVRRDSADATKIAAIVVGPLLLLCFIFGAVRWKRFLGDRKKNPQPPNHSEGLKLASSSATAKTSILDGADIELQQVVGRGHFATVWQAKYQGCVVVVKVFPTSCKQRFTVEREVYELPLMKHDSIIPFLGAGTKPDDGGGFLILERAEFGSLHSYLRQHTSGWVLSLKLSLTLSQGLSFLHSDIQRHGVRKPAVAHRDLSSSNVLVRADGTCALSDFGCSTVLRSPSGGRPWQYYMRNMAAGTLRYMSPEILEGSINLSNSWCLMQGDVYALGLLLWEISMRCSELFQGLAVPEHLLPYESELGADATLERLVVHIFHLDNRPCVPTHWELLPQASSMQELMIGCWDRDPEARLTAQCVADICESLQSSAAV